MKENKSIKIKTGIPIVLIIFSLIALTGCTEFTDLLGDNTDEGTYTIIFKVTDKETGNPISAARIGWRYNDGDIRMFHTPATGKITIDDVEPGRYSFYVDGDATHYDSIQKEFDLTESVLIKITLSTDTSTCEIVEI